MASKKTAPAKQDFKALYEQSQADLAELEGVHGDLQHQLDQVAGERDEAQANARELEDRCAQLEEQLAAAASGRARSVHGAASLGRGSPALGASGDDTFNDSTALADALGTRAGESPADEIRRLRALAQSLHGKENATVKNLISKLEAFVLPACVRAMLAGLPACLLARRG